MRKVKALFRILAISALVLFGGFTLLDLIHPSLRSTRRQISSIDIPLPENNKIVDFLTRSPVAMLSLVPENLQSKIGLSIFLKSFGRGLDSDSLENIRSSVGKLYQDMDDSPEWKVMPSATGYTGLDLLGISPQRAHAYIYLPESAKGNPKTAVIFLHGSLGNLKAYPYIWSKYAESTGSLIICPSYGFGFWGRENKVIDTILAALPEQFRVPRDHTIIAGLSAGGLGVAREILKHPDYQAALFISAVIPEELVLAADLPEKWNKKPLLIVNGTADKIITADFAQRRAIELAPLGASIHLFQGASHFLLMTDPTAIFHDLEQATAER